MNTTDKLTPQEAALYLGQECFFRWPAWAKEAKWATSIITPERLHDIEKDCIVKLKARPLSDISEEEAIRILEIRTGMNLSHCRGTITPSGRYIVISAETESQVVALDRFFIEPNQLYTPNETAYLLKQGFCLFPEWFEQGKAEMITRIFYTKIQ